MLCFLLALAAYLGPCLPLSRARHVKCDESKPACRKCQDTGRICDGYAKSGEKQSVEVPSLLHEKVALQTLTTISDSHFQLLKTEDDRKCFHFFQYDTRQQVNHAFGSATQAHRLMLQASHSNASICHIVVALGSLGQHLHGNDMADQPKGSLLLFSDEKYVKAIAQLRDDIGKASSPSTELILISCFLLTLFDFLRGKDVAARVHMQAGMNILRQCYGKELVALIDKSPYHQPNNLVADFALIFSLMDLHATMWLGELLIDDPCLPQKFQPTPEHRIMFLTSLRPAIPLLTSPNPAPMDSLGWPHFSG